MLLVVELKYSVERNEKTDFRFAQDDKGNVEFIEKSHNFT